MPPGFGCVAAWGDAYHGSIIPDHCLPLCGRSIQFRLLHHIVYCDSNPSGLLGAPASLGINSWHGKVGSRGGGGQRMQALP